YCFGIDSAGYLLHVYWGPRLRDARDYETPETHHEKRPMERGPAVSREEFPVWGDYSYAEPCLKAEFADGVRTVLMTLAGSEIGPDAHTLTIRLNDPQYPLSVALVYRVVPEHDLIERSAVVENRGTDPITLDRVMTAAWTFPRRDRFRLRWLNGKWAGEFQVQ